jgi:hypothetical protein
MFEQLPALTQEPDNSDHGVQVQAYRQPRKMDAVRLRSPALSITTYPA